ncbi:spore germination protein [Cohnella lubricantis]|uniref:Spore germination protein n=1 Tax=Cohnella lubricantis TaxID=2163172 RepID=A0A841TAD9_9BACL|nr:spore germination protein [Cohnella lubricantis]MBB6677952.1 spore germination protein [Cohnella lubricantis]MBP2119980.1 spore germination protein KA [Cohnella lubricantis]
MVRYRMRGSAKTEPQPEPVPLSAELARNEQWIRSVCSSCSDVVYRPFKIGGRTSALLIFVDGLADDRGIEDFVIAPLMREDALEAIGLQEMLRQKVEASDASELETLDECVVRLMDGYPILLCEGELNALALGLAKWEMRAVEEPAGESAVRGPREGFTETLRINTSQIRRIIRSPKLKMDSVRIGGYTRTHVVVAYIQGVADAAIVEEVKSRLSRIQADGILESVYIEEFIEDNPYSPFPQLLDTERPDVVCASLLEGRVAILTEGSPFALVAPITFSSLMQAAEDYYQRYIFSTFIRWLRYFFLMISLLLPSLYVAVLTFHQEMVPSSLLFSMASSREDVPFPALVEAILMEVSFEALREAGLRLPKQIGSAVSIVGALVVGESAVQAGLVSAPMVIVVALTGIASCMIPRYVASNSIRMLRFPMIFLAGTLGLLGIMMGIIALVLHLSSLRSIGLPYMASLATPRVGEWKDVLIRAPWWSMTKRPRLTGTFDQRRLAPGQKPSKNRG